MSVPTSRAEFRDHCLRLLGYPVIDVNVTTEQIDDRIDDALKYYADYHFDGTEHTYLKHQVTQDDIDQGYIGIPGEVIGIVGIFNIGHGFVGGSDIFAIDYQIFLNDLYSLTSQSLLPYWMVVERLQFMQDILVGSQRIRFNRHTDRMFFDFNTDRIKPGEFLVLDCYMIVRPALYDSNDQLIPGTYPDVWNDRWLIRYCTAQIKKQWGTNLSKFSGVILPGGVTLNGDKMYADAVAELEKLENEMQTKYSLPPAMMVG